MDEFAVAVVVVTDSDHFWEVVAVPFSDSHGEGVNVFVELIDQCDGLDDHVVLSVNVEPKFGSRVTMRETSLGGVLDQRSQRFLHLWEVLSGGPADLDDSFTGG